jgi:hypothetical protein
MRMLRHLQYWLTGGGPHIRVADFVPETHPVRQWADTFPWVAVYERLKAAITIRHYSPKTLQAYKAWTRQLQTFAKSKDPH